MCDKNSKQVPQLPAWIPALVWKVRHLVKHTFWEKRKGRDQNQALTPDAAVPSAGEAIQFPTTTTTLVPKDMAQNL